MILVRGMLDGFGDKQDESLLPGSDTPSQTASESTRIAKIHPAQQIRIAMPRFVTRSAAEEALGDKIANMIVENLAGSGLFTVVDINSYGDTVSAIDEPKIFSQRHQIDARALSHRACRGIHSRFGNLRPLVGCAGRQATHRAAVRDRSG